MLQKFERDSVVFNFLVLLLNSSKIPQSTELICWMSLYYVLSTSRIHVKIELGVDSVIMYFCVCADIAMP